MLALNISLALGVIRVQTPALTGLNHFLFILYHVNIVIAGSSDHTDPILLDIKDEVVLSHECAAH